MKAVAKLTPRQEEIAELLVWGKAKKEVADRLSISERRDDIIDWEDYLVA